MLRFRQDFIKRIGDEYVYDGKMNDERNEEEILLTLNSPKSYDIFEVLNNSWGNWNECPEWKEMWKKAKEWNEKYEAEVVKLSHDTVTFTCRKLSEIEARNLMEEATQLYALIIDCEEEELLNHLMEKETFTLWWD